MCRKQPKKNRSLCVERIIQTKPRLYNKNNMKKRIVSLIPPIPEEGSDGDRNRHGKRSSVCHNHGITLRKDSQPPRIKSVNHDDCPPLRHQLKVGDLVTAICFIDPNTGRPSRLEGFNSKQLLQYLRTHDDEIIQLEITEGKRKTTKTKKNRQYMHHSDSPNENRYSQNQVPDEENVLISLSFLRDILLPDDLFVAFGWDTIGDNNNDNNNNKLPCLNCERKKSSTSTVFLSEKDTIIRKKGCMATMREHRFTV